MNLYKQILEATAGLDGWCSDGKALTLANLVIATQAKLIVEIGVWGGKSLFPMAIAARSIGPCQIIGIDAWKASESILGQSERDADWWNKQEQHDLVYMRFIENCQRLELSNLITIVRKSSNDVHPPDMIDLLHVDGNHGPQALTDTTRFAVNIRSGGICVLDDLGWTGGAVGQAAEWLKANGFLELHQLGTGAAYLKL